MESQGDRRFLCIKEEVLVKTYKSIPTFELLQNIITCVTVKQASLTCSGLWSHLGMERGVFKELQLWSQQRAAEEGASLCTIKAK